MLVEALFTRAEKWKQPKYPSMDECTKNFGISIQRNVIQSQKELTTDPWYRTSRNVETTVLRERN